MVSGIVILALATLATASHTSGATLSARGRQHDVRQHQCDLSVLIQVEGLACVVEPSDSCIMCCESSARDEVAALAPYCREASSEEEVQRALYCITNSFVGYICD
jgi:hypothetical protein